MINNASIYTNVYTEEQTTIKIQLVSQVWSWNARTCAKRVGGGGEWARNGWDGSQQTSYEVHIRTIRLKRSNELSGTKTRLSLSSSLPCFVSERACSGARRRRRRAVPFPECRKQVCTPTCTSPSDPAEDSGEAVQKSRVCSTSEKNIKHQNFNVNSHYCIFQLDKEKEDTANAESHSWSAFYKMQEENTHFGSAQIFWRRRNKEENISEEVNVEEFLWTRGKSTHGRSYQRLIDNRARLRTAHKIGIVDSEINVQLADTKLKKIVKDEKRECWAEIIVMKKW